MYIYIGRYIKRGYIIYLVYLYTYVSCNSLCEGKYAMPIENNIAYQFELFVAI